MPLSTCERAAPPSVASSDPVSTRTSAAGIEALFRSHHVPLLRFLARRVGADEATDLLQETFLRMLRNGAAGSIRHPAAFLRRVATNLMIDRARRRAREEALFVPLRGDHDAPVRPAQEERMAAKELLAHYEAAVAEMPPRMQRVFLMSRVDGLAYREIADALAISPSAVEQHMTKALGRLSAALDQET